MFEQGQVPLPPVPAPLLLGVLASGRGSNLQAIIDAIEGGRLAASIAVVLSNKAGAFALERAKKHRIPTAFVDPKQYGRREDYDDALLEALKAHQVELVILAGYMRLLTGHLVKPFHHRMINIHPSLLPAFPGLHAQRQAIAYGVKVSGCTVHFVDEEMDNGPIIAQTTVPVVDGDTEEDLAGRILVEEHRLLPSVIQRIAEGKLRMDGRRVLHLEKARPHLEMKS